MTYTIVSPTVNDANGYKDTGILGFYRWQDIQCLAELFAQANASVVVDAKQDARGGMRAAQAQLPVNTTVWLYLGNEAGGLNNFPNYLQPLAMYLDYNRVNYMADGSFPVPLMSTVNTSWLYLITGNISPITNLNLRTITKDNRLSVGGSNDALMKAFFSRVYDVDLKIDPECTGIQGMNRPFQFRAWTAREDVEKLYRDAKIWANCVIGTISWKDNLFEHVVYGHALDETFAPATYSRDRKLIRQNQTSGPHQQTTWNINTGYSNDTFGRYEMWDKTETNTWHDGTVDPTDYGHYEWTSETDTFTSSQPSIDRNVPVPTQEWCQNCLGQRYVIFVWKVKKVKTQWWHWGTPATQTTENWYYFMTEMTRLGQNAMDYHDYDNHQRGICQKYYISASDFDLMWSQIKAIENFQIPTFDMSVFRTDGTYEISETQTIEGTIQGAWSVQFSHLTEVPTYPV